MESYIDIMIYIYRLFNYFIFQLHNLIYYIFSEKLFFYYFIIRFIFLLLETYLH